MTMQRQRARSLESLSHKKTAQNGAPKEQKELQKGQYIRDGLLIDKIFRKNLLTSNEN